MALNRYDLDKIDEPLVDVFEDTPEVVTCEKCRKQTTDGELVFLLVYRQTRSSPAEYEDQMWCGTCRDRAEAGDTRSADAPGWED